MATEDAFAAAQVRVKELARRPSDDELLELYALYKQATAGDVSGKRPGLLDFKGRAKFDAWSRRKGESGEACRQQYVRLVERLVKQHGGG